MPQQLLYDQLQIAPSCKSSTFTVEDWPICGLENVDGSAAFQPIRQSHPHSLLTLISSPLNSTALFYTHHHYKPWESAQERSESPVNTEHATEPPSVSFFVKSKFPNTPHTVVPSAERTRSSVLLLESGPAEVVKRLLLEVLIV